MSITSRSLQKLLRENIIGGAPLTVSVEQAQELTEDLLARIEPLAGATHHERCHHLRRYEGGSVLPNSPATSPPPETLCCCILLEEASDRWYHRQTHLHLLRSSEQQLWVELGGERSPTPVSDISEVVALAQAFLQRVNQQKAKAAKRQKQQDLKVQAILAQVRKIAKEDQFDFATEVDSIKLKLIIRLSDNDYFAILIPFNRFKEVLPKLRTAIQTLRETYNSGVRFKTHLKRGYRRSDWIRHQDL
ncbi:MAG: hypothetical protein F6K30_09720 [Cyanothece sp. SIO2G6]|nr:hypothetical protein [Cyanothece sp. SIO2G6]